MSSKYLRELVESKKYGNIVAVKADVTWDRDEKYYSDDWHGTLDKEGGGVIINQCIHTLDLIQWLVSSEVVSVDGSVSQKRLRGKVETEDTADALITFKNGVQALFYGTLCYKANSSVFLEILFENGRAVMYDDLVITDSEGNRDVVALKKTKGGYVLIYCLARRRSLPLLQAYGTGKYLLGNKRKLRQHPRIQRA